MIQFRVLGWFAQKPPSSGPSFGFASSATTRSSVKTAGFFFPSPHVFNVSWLLCSSSCQERILKEKTKEGPKLWCLSGSGGIQGT